MRLTESQLKRIIKESVLKALVENTEPTIKSGNQIYAKPADLEYDRQRFEKKFQELMETGKTMISSADKDFDEWLIENHPEVNYGVKPCADFYERTKFYLINDN
jgi:hypothetical protein